MVLCDIVKILWYVYIIVQFVLKKVNFIDLLFWCVCVLVFVYIVCFSMVNIGIFMKFDSNVELVSVGILKFND